MTPSESTDTGNDNHVKKASDFQKESAISVILGVFSLISSVIPLIAFMIAIAGMALGAKGRQGSYRSLATAGIVLNLLGIILAMVLWIVAFAIAAQKYSH